MMTTPGQALAASVRAASGAALIFIEGLSAADYLHRPCAQANCAAWIVGHLVLTSRSMLGRLNVSELPALPAGFEARFGQRDGAPLAGAFGDVTILPGLFKTHHDRLAAAAESMSATHLMTALAEPHPRFKTAGEMLAFAPTHIAMHVGQISTIRRTLGRPALF